MASTSTAPVVQNAADPQPKSSNRNRKRAPKACLSCRARKVRCDVSQRGRPCTNCYLDSDPCVVTGRASRFHKHRDICENGQASSPSYPQQIAANPAAEAAAKARTTSGQAGPVNTHSGSISEDHCHDHMRESVVALSPPTTAETPQSVSRQPQFNRTPQYSAPNPQVISLAQEFCTGVPVYPWAPPQPPQLAADIVYSYYPFLSISNLAHILPQDVNYLESQGCFRVPTRAVLDEFVQQYFLHVHPLLPLLNEGDFWDVYCKQPTGSVPQHQISLLVFQSLIFATCNFVSRNSLTALGYPSLRAARAALYRRAKLLYDFESECSSISIAQAALLLSFWSPVSSSGIRKASSAWLAIAIQQARAAEAHHYSSFGPSTTPTPAPARHEAGARNDDDKTAAQPPPRRLQNVLKRLWWCCVVRDRVLALHRRRSVQITRAHFDVDDDWGAPSNGPLGPADLADEVGRSRVYAAEAKRALAGVTGRMVGLCVALTDVLALVYPPDDTHPWARRPARPEDDRRRVREGRAALRRWYDGATLLFSTFGGDVGGGGGGSRGSRHDSVILYTNLLYMYYHSARAALCHYEVLNLALASSQGSVDGSVCDISAVYENRQELQEASSGVSECLKDLIQLRLARWLPSSAVACTALPLVLHVLDVKLSSSRPGVTGTDGQAGQSALAQQRLDALVEAMKTYRPQYDGMDWVSQTIRHIVDLAQPDGVQLNTSDNNSSSNNGTSESGLGNSKSQDGADWTDILTSHASLYLRLALAMDFSLSQDRLPDDGNLLSTLRGLLAGDSDDANPLYLLLSADKNQQQEQHQQEQRLRPVPGSMSSIIPPDQQQQQPPSPIDPDTMKNWLETDRSVSYAIHNGVDMDLDAASLRPGRGQGSHSESESGSQDESYESADEQQHHRIHGHRHQHDTRMGVDQGGQQRQQQQQQQLGLFSQPSSEEMEMDGMVPHVLDAFTLHDESARGRGPEGIIESGIEIFGDALGADARVFRLLGC